MAAVIRVRGFRPAIIWALLSENRPEWVTGYLGIIFAGGVVIPIDSMLPQAEMLTVLGASPCQRVAHHSKILARVAANRLLKRVTLPPMIVLDGPPESLSLNGHGKTPLPETKPDDLACIIFTSGTTGFSKGVMLTHRNLCSDTKSHLGRGHYPHRRQFSSAPPPPSYVFQHRKLFGRAHHRSPRHLCHQL